MTPSAISSAWIPILAENDKCFFYSHQRAPDDQWLITYSALLVLARGHDLSCSANAVSAENHKFSLPLSFSALAQGWPLSNWWKSFKVPETRDFQTADSEDLVILACTGFDWSTRVMERWTDRQTDRQMDGRTELQWLRCATAVAAVMHKNTCIQ